MTLLFTMTLLSEDEIQYYSSFSAAGFLVLAAGFAAFSASPPASFSLFFAAGLAAGFAVVLGLAVLAGFAAFVSTAASAAGVSAIFAVPDGNDVTEPFFAFLRRRTPKDPKIIFPLFDFLSPLPIY